MRRLFLAGLAVLGLCVATSCTKLDPPPELSEKNENKPPPSPRTSWVAHSTASQVTGSAMLGMQDMRYQESAVEVEGTADDHPADSTSQGAADAGAPHTQPRDFGPQPIREGMQLEIEGVTQNDEQFQWENYRGHVVVVTFWASWCRGCRDWLSQSEKLIDAYGSKGLLMVGVNSDRDPRPVKGFLERLGIQWENVIDSLSGFPMRDKYQYRYIPHIVVVDRQGKIVGAGIRGQELANKLHELLGPPVNVARAKAGAGKKGRGYGGGMVTEPIAAHFRIRQKLVFDVQIPEALKLFEAEHGFTPRSHDEFLDEVIEKNNIELPELPEGHSYVFNPVKKELMVRRPR